MDEKMLQLLVLPETAHRNAAQNIIPCLDGDRLTGNNRTYQRMYDRLAPFYDAITAFYARVRNGGERNRVAEYLSSLSVRDGDCVVEISVGTGRNLKYLNPRAHYCGVDISSRMLLRCGKMMKKQGRDVTLIQAQAENLPIKSDSFDVVFSAGGFNFFNDKRKAVEEMLRVAKSGTLLMISDETEKIRAKYDKVPLAQGFYQQPQIGGPRGYLPESCTDVTYTEICSGELYVLTFRKP